jgi:hypothetical protein
VLFPVLHDDRATRVRDESLQRSHQQKDVVDLAEERDPVGNEIDGSDDVRNGGTDQNLVDGPSTDHREAARSSAADGSCP